MRVKILKTDDELCIRAGEVYEAEEYDDNKVVLLSRVSDGYDPECTQYNCDVEILVKMSNRFTIERPCIEWTYLYRDSFKCLDVIRVVLTSARTEYGVNRESYLSVPKYGGRNVTQLNGTFAKIEEG